MNAETADRSLFQRNRGIHFRVLQRIERFPVIFHLHDETIWIELQEEEDFMHHAVREAVLDHVGNMFFEAQVSRLEDRRLQKCRPRKFLQCGYGFVPVGGLECENGLQGTGELAAFLNQGVLKAGHGENRSNLGGRLCHL
jgi:hypothetical protein